MFLLLIWSVLSVSSIELSAKECGNGTLSPRYGDVCMCQEGWHSPWKSDFTNWYCEGYANGTKYVQVLTNETCTETCIWSSLNSNVTCGLMKDSLPDCHAFL